MKYESMFQRLIANSRAPESECGCWNWTGNKHAKGYGRLNVRRNGKHKSEFAHREMSRQVQGEFIEVDLDDDPVGPIGLIPRLARHVDDTDDHLCWNRICINPDHFENVTRSENTRRRNARTKDAP